MFGLLLDVPKSRNWPLHFPAFRLVLLFCTAGFYSTAGLGTTDVWSLACVVFALLQPFTAPLSNALLYDICRMGANIIRNGALTPAWRENTLRSFQAAAASGASFVEFDVQVTSDGVPVVWHDNFVEYGDPAHPTQCRVSDLTAAEFQALGQLSASGRCQQLSVVRRFRTVTREAAALSAILPPQAAPHGEPMLAQRLRWCCEADDSFPTLEQLFSALPPHLAFNIEVKMVTPDDLAVTPAAEVQRMVDPIMEVVNKCSSSSSSNSSTQQQRQVVFSSFDPDICKALRASQDHHPVLFLTTGGRDWHADPRRMSIAAAIEEAVASCLSGIVVDSGALAAAPEAAAVARSKGLTVLTYGLENDNINWVLRQQQLGVTGIIVDDVQGLMNALSNDVSSDTGSAAAEAGVVLAGGGVAVEGFSGQAGMSSSMPAVMPAGDFVAPVAVPVRAS
jgi:glycerophosphodiester phosphodiesterase